MTIIQRVFIVEQDRPLRRIWSMEAEIFSGPKMTWARDIRKTQIKPTARRRYLLGSTAFFTEAAAERAKLGALRKILQRGVIWRLYPNVMNEARDQLRRYETTKKFYH